MKSTTPYIPEENELTTQSGEDMADRDYAEIKSVFPKGIH